VENKGNNKITEHRAIFHAKGKANLQFLIDCLYTFVCIAVGDTVVKSGGLEFH